MHMVYGVVSKRMSCCQDNCFWAAWKIKMVDMVLHHLDVVLGIPYVLFEGKHRKFPCQQVLVSETAFHLNLLTVLLESLIKMLFLVYSSYTWSATKPTHILYGHKYSHVDILCVDVEDGAWLRVRQPEWIWWDD